MKRSGPFIAVLAMCTWLSSAAFAGSLTLRLGPPGAGNGGPNPLSIPPSLADVDITWVTAKKLEFSLSVIPGLLIGQRWTTSDGLYVSGGGGLIIGANGSGLGVYTAFGWEWKAGDVLLNAELKQALGIGGVGFISPYALRVGAGLELSLFGTISLLNQKSEVTRDASTLCLRPRCLDTSRWTRPHSSSHSGLDHPDGICAPR